MDHHVLVLLQRQQQQQHRVSPAATPGAAAIHAGATAKITPIQAVGFYGWLFTLLIIRGST